MITNQPTNTCLLLSLKENNQDYLGVTLILVDIFLRYLKNAENNEYVENRFETGRTGGQGQ
jgi:hypothetical protein